MPGDGDLKGQIFHRPTWESYYKELLICFATSGSRVWPVTFYTTYRVIIFYRVHFRCVALDRTYAAYKPWPYITS